ncbi:two-partner secretion domain-containing protein [Bartonella sp. B23]
MTYDKREKRTTLFGILLSSTMLKKVLISGISLPFLLQFPAVQAQIVVDPNVGSAYRLDIVAAPNGVLSIDIVTPNGKGLSHNKYYDFNIGNSGVILNNHAGKVGQSQLGGIMPGNPHLRFSGSAKVILNEVTSGKRSALNGPAEVFGHKADVIIANPNGITCDGCGFINTPRATLTTGVPQIDAAGFLKGFEVKGGDITFGRSGANFFSGKGSVDILDIVSRTVHFEGSVAGREIGVTVGTGHFDYTFREMNGLTDVTGKPEYAIDGSALGALQADRIKLVATEKGVAVRMRHDMAANVGQLQLSSDGKISLKNVFGHGGVILKSRSKNVVAKRIMSKKNVEIVAHQGIALETLGADGHLIADAQSGILSIIGKATTGKNMDLSSLHGIKVSQLYVGADLTFETGGNLTVDGHVSAESNLKAHVGGNIQAHFLAGGIDMAATAAAGVIVLGKQGDVDLRSVKGSIASDNIYGAGDIKLVSHEGIFVSKSILSYHNVAICTQPDVKASVRFGQLVAYDKADISGWTVAFSSLMTGSDAVLTAESFDAGTVISGVDFARSNGVTGDIVLHDKGSLSIIAQKGAKVGQIVSGKNIDIFAGNEIYYDQVMGHGTATLTSVSGAISIKNEMSISGDVRLTAKTLDLSNDRSHIHTLQTLYLIADNINVSESTLIYGGLDFNSTNALEMHHASLKAITDEGGTGDIVFIAPSVMVDQDTSILAARDFMIKTVELENSGQLASGQDLVFSVTGNVINNKTGLIYAGSNGALKVKGAFLNDFGTILAKHNLFFVNAQGIGKSLSFVNKAGLIQAGGNLTIKTKSLKNEADSTPVVNTKKIESKHFAFEKPDNYSSLNEVELFNKKTLDLLSKGDINGPLPEHREFILEEAILGKKERTYGKLIWNGRTLYKAFTWKIAAAHGKNRMQTYVWNDSSYMTEKTVTQRFSHKPTVQGIIQSTGDLIIHADNIDNFYSTVEAGGNSNIYAGVLINLGATTYKNTYLGCKAGTDNCYAYNADGSRNSALDLANDAFRHTGSVVTDTVSALVRAGGTLNLVVDQINNKAAEGSIAGSAHFKAKAVAGNPLEALKSLTESGGGLFTQKINRDAFFNGRDLPLAKLQSGGDDSTFPKQNFLYETQTDFLDVSKFYGSAYYLNRIGYNPDREIFFLGDAYFEKQLIEKQLRDLVGQGLGKGSFIPGSDAIEQVKTLLDKGVNYVKSHHLSFGESLSKEQLTSLEIPMVIYTRQKVKGIDVYAPVLYIPEKERASFISSGALITGNNVDLIAKNMSNSTINNSGRVKASHQLYIKGGNILNHGGHLTAGDNIVLVADKNIRFETGYATVDSIKTALKTDAVFAGGNAVASAKKDVIASGVCITARSGLALSAEQGTLSVGSTAITNRIGQRNFVEQYPSKVSSGSLMVLLAGKDLNVASSCIQAHDTLHLQAEGNVVMEAIHNSINNNAHGETSRLVLHKTSYLSAGKDISVKSGRGIHVAASTLNAEGYIALDAQKEVTVGARKDEMVYHLQTQNMIIDRHVSAFVGASIKAGDDIMAIAGKDGKQHDLTITQSNIISDGKVGLKASNDILITNTENSLQREVSLHTTGGVFGGSKSVHNNVANAQIVSANISGSKGAALDSGRHTQFIGSALVVGMAEKMKNVTSQDSLAANISIVSGGNIIITGKQERFNQQKELSKSGFLRRQSSNQFQKQLTTLSSGFIAKGDIVMEAKEDTMISGSKLFAGQDITVTGAGVSIIGMEEHYNVQSEKRNSGLWVGANSSSLSLWGRKAQTQTDKTGAHKVTSIVAGGTVNIIAEKSDLIVGSSDLTASRDLIFSAAHDISVIAGHKIHSMNFEEKHSDFGIHFKENRSNIPFSVGISSSMDKGHKEENFANQAGFAAGRDVQISAKHNAHLQATDIFADRDVNVYAGNDVTLLANHNVFNANEMHDTLFAGVKVVVNADFLSTVKDMEDVAMHFKHGESKDEINNGTIANTKGDDFYNKGKNLYNGIKGETTKDIFLNTENVSSSVTVDFISSKIEASSHASVAVTDKIEAKRAVSIEANKGTIHGVGADVIIGANSAYIPNNGEHNNEHSKEIILKARQNITLESAQNVQKSTTKSRSASINFGYSYGKGGMSLVGNGFFNQQKKSDESVQHKNSNLSGTGNIRITSGTGTTLSGAVVSGKSIKANIGGDFTIASRSDNSQTFNVQKFASVRHHDEENTDTANINGNWLKNKSFSHYENILEQSGIKAGEQGFDMTVTGKTTLTSGIIDSIASADKNTLTTATITTSDIATSAKAQANSDEISISAGGALQQGKYGIAKNLAKNAFNHGKFHDLVEGETKSAISNGTVIITNEIEQEALTGQIADQRIASLNRNTTEARQDIERLDVEKLEQIARENREMKIQLLEKGFQYSDEAYRTMFIKEHPIAVIDRDEKGKVIYLKDKRGRVFPQYHYLTPEEKQSLQAGSDGKIHIFINGIFTSANKAAAYTLQHADNNNEPHYFVHFPKSNTVLSELMIAGYQKFMENNFFGLSNSTRKVQNLVILNGNDGLHFDAHSRGSMTVGNALQSLDQKGKRRLAGKTTVNLFGPAFNAQSMADTLERLSDGKKMSVGLENHKYDFVGRWIGRNPYTFEQIPADSNGLIETFKTITNPVNVHSCLGSGKPRCTQLYGLPHRVQIHSRKGK